jgi:hypothetical protein
MKRKRVVSVLTVAVIVLAIATLAFLKLRKYEIIGTVESVRLPICTQNTTSPTCGEGVVQIRTEDGAIKEYKYAPDKSESGEFNFVSLQKGTKIKLVVSRGRITTIE